MDDLLSSLPDDKKDEEDTDATAAMPEPEEMHQTALVFLEDPLARKLAVAWRACGGDERVWLVTAGILRAQHDDARRVSEALRLNGICRAHGEVDELALRYIAVLAAKPLEGRRRKK